MARALEVCGELQGWNEHVRVCVVKRMGRVLEDHC